MKLIRAMSAVVVLVVLFALPENGRGHVAAPAETWPVWPESAAASREDYITLSCPVIVYTNPEGVWEVLTTVRSFSLWYPHWEHETNMLRKLTAVGDTITFFMEGKAAGRSVVIRFAPLNSIRIVHELDDGRLYGSISVSLTDTENGVGMTYIELVPSAGLALPQERCRVCKQAILIKRLAEGE